MDAAEGFRKAAEETRLLREKSADEQARKFRREHRWDWLKASLLWTAWVLLVLVAVAVSFGVALIIIYALVALDFWILILVPINAFAAVLLWRFSFWVYDHLA